MILPNELVAGAAKGLGHIGQTQITFFTLGALQIVIFGLLPKKADGSGEFLNPSEELR